LQVALERAAVFCGALLLFLVEPLIARVLLPQFGGTAAVWLTSLLFFQAALLAGYLLAHFARGKWPLVALLVLACAALPVRASTGLLGGAPPAVRLLALLAQAVGLPFLALATTGPAVQALQPRRGLSPWRLYSLSNFASALGLLCYPLLLEPLLTLRAQALLFSAAFAAFALLYAVVLLRAPRPEAPAAPGERHALEAPALVVLLPACSSALLLAVTASITQNLAPVPLLWMLPLALYLASFVVAFRAPGAMKRIWGAPLVLVSLGGLAALEGHVVPNWALGPTIAGVLAAFALTALALHSELAKLTPHPSELTRYYLSIAAGSVIGSLFVAVVAPLALRRMLDLPICLVACAAALGVAWVRAPAPRLVRVLLQAAPAAIGIIVWWRLGARPGEVVLRARNFYGALTVRDEDPDEDGFVRILINGTINHGAQSWEGVPRAPARKPTTYYAPASGVGRAVRMLAAEKPALTVGVIGLGAGVLAAYCRPGDAYHFYEINPLVERIARTQFTFLGSCAGAQVHLGDARLTLAAEPPRGFDLLAVDAFSSDSIPVHLLTREAFALFARHLAPDGVLAVHVSNRYLDLTPVVTAHADRLGWPSYGVDDDGEADDLATASSWILLAPRHPLPGDKLVRGPRQDWTDDWSNLVTLLR